MESTILTNEEDEVEEEETLVEKFARFQAEVHKLQQKPDALEKELTTQRAKLERMKVGRAGQLAQDQTQKAEVLLKEIQKLEPEIEVLEAKLSALGPGGRESAQSLVADSPGSPLFDLACQIVEEVAALAPDLEDKLQIFLHHGLDDKKLEYLAAIESFANGLHKLWQIALAGLTAQKYLPNDLRVIKKPRLIAPLTTVFEINYEDIGEYYQPLSRTSLPD